MKPLFRNSTLLRAAGICAALWLISSCANPETNTKRDTALEAENDAPALQADAVLHQRLQTVLEADEAFTQAVGSAPVTEMDAKSGAIIQAEMALQKCMDSLEQNKNGDNNPALAQQLEYFKAILQNRRTVSDLRMLVSASTDDSTTMRQTVTQLRKELAEKNKTIATLERTAQLRNPTPNVTAEYDNGMKAYAPAKSESVADLRQRNKNLSLAYSSLQNKYLVLGRNYLVLKQNNERTEQQLEALRKTGSQK